MKRRKWIEDYVESETAVARKQFEDAETAINKEQEDVRKAENTGLMTGAPEKTCQEMMVANGVSLCDLASSDDEEDGEDEDDEDTELGKLSKDDKPWWVMGTVKGSPLTEYT